MPNSSQNNILPRESPECAFVVKEKGKQFVEESKALPINPMVKTFLINLMLTNKTKMSCTALRAEVRFYFSHQLVFKRSPSGQQTVSNKWSPKHHQALSKLSQVVWKGLPNGHQLATIWSQCGPHWTLPKHTTDSSNVCFCQSDCLNITTQYQQIHFKLWPHNSNLWPINSDLNCENAVVKLSAAIKLLQTLSPISFSISAVTLTTFGVASSSARVRSIKS